MKTNIRKIAAALLLLTPFFALAQRDVKKYRQESEAMRKEVWAWNKPEFAVRTIPSEYTNASRVVIARHFELNFDSKKKTSFTGLGFTVYRELTLTDIVREAVKINDKSAVADYSEISYTQLEKRSGYIKDKTTAVYVGVKVIKPDGSVKEINADDVVLTKDEKREKEAKVAIPDLQPGDIVDYFIAKQTSMTQDNNIAPHTYSFFDDDPIMHYSIHCEIGKKYAVEYRAYNGAPDFKQSTGEDNGIVLDAVKKNIAPLTRNDFWLSAYRQLPILRMNIMIGYDGMFAGRLNARKPGQVYKNQSADEFIEDEINTLASYKASLGTTKSYVSTGNTFAETTSDYYKKLKKEKKGISADSLAAELYYLYRFESFCTVTAASNIEKVVNRGRMSLNESKYMYNMANLLTSADVNNKLVLLTSKYGPDMKSIMSKDDIVYLLQVDGAKQNIFGITDMFTPAFYIPSYNENAKGAITLDMGGLRRDYTAKSFEKGTTNVGGTDASANSRLEQLGISANLEKGQLEIKRKTTLKGHYKSDVQKELILFEDFYESERKLLGQEKSLIESLEANKRSRKYADELKAAFTQERIKQKDAFKKEADGWFEQEITDLNNYKIENLGVRHNNPDFVYRSDFNMNGLVKKAGKNYIIEVGKLQGSPLKVEEEQRKRNVDVYAPFARSLNFEITLQVPEGYTAEGISSLNKNVANECGSFIANATMSGNTITIKVSKAYTKAFEPSANWIKLLTFIDAANEWSNAKILFKKK